MLTNKLTHCHLYYNQTLMYTTHVAFDSNKAKLFFLLHQAYASLVFSSPIHRNIYLDEDVFCWCNVKLKIVLLIFKV